MLHRFMLCAAFSSAYSAFAQEVQNKQKKKAAHRKYMDKIQSGRSKLHEMQQKSLSALLASSSKRSLWAVPKSR